MWLISSFRSKLLKGYLQYNQKIADLTSIVSYTYVEMTNKTKKSTVVNYHWIFFCYFHVLLKNYYCEKQQLSYNHPLFLVGDDHTFFRRIHIDSIWFMIVNLWRKKCQFMSCCHKFAEIETVCLKKRIVHVINTLQWSKISQTIKTQAFHEVI